MKTYAEIETLTEFFEEYGEALAEKADRKLRPLHIPGTDPISFKWDVKFPRGPFRRKPYEPQAHVIEAARKSLDHQGQVWIIGEPGTGKTLMGMCTAHVHARGMPYRGLIVCPDHLCDKWEREIEETIPNAIVNRVEHWSEMLSLIPETVPFKFNLWHQPECPEWTILGRDKCKLGPAWRAAAVARHTSLREAKYVLRCPDCGALITNDDGDPVSWDKMPKNRKRLRCTARVGHLTGVGNDQPTWEERVCDGILWTFKRKPYYRWAPERVINTKLRGYYHYLILDEMHEYKGGNTAQANAAGAIAAVARNTIAMTGTLIGGRADHLFPLTYRLMPRTLVEEGFRWNDTMEFVKKYGKIERTVKTGGKDRTKSNKNSRGGTGDTVSEKAAPGILPGLFRHVMGHCVFLGLAEMAANLPKLDEGTVRNVMDDETCEAVEEINEELVPIACEMAAKGNIRLLGAMLEVLLYYPDHPYGWGPIGYEDPETGGWVPVMTPKELSPDVVRPKEQEWLDFVCEEKKKGNQVWTYIQRNGERDVLARLERLAARAGYVARSLRSSVNRNKRESWIAQQGRDVDVMISHPQLVETGLDLFSKKRGGHNYSSLYFYQTGYRPFTMMQAGRRSWRLGQKKRCKIRYGYYQGTAQEGALNLMGHKMKATLALQGQYSEDGLAAMTGDDQDAMSLAKQLTKQLNDTGRVWEMVTEQMGTNGGGLAEDGEYNSEEDEADNGVVVDDDFRAQFLNNVATILQPASRFDVTARMADLRRRLGR